jgi:hypothetical protein
MLRQFKAEEEREKRHHRALEALKTGSEEAHPTDTPEDDEIDPAEYFDPEEFGIRRKFHSRA